MRERILAVVRGRPADRVPFVQYEGQVPTEQLRSHLGRDRVGLLRWCRPYRVTHPNCTRSDEPIEGGQRTTLHTPGGSLTQESRREPGYGSVRTIRHFVREPADYDALIAWFADAEVRPEPQTLRRDRRELGDDGVPLLAVPRTPYQQLWIRWVDIRHLSLHLADRPDRVHQCMEQMGRVLREVFEAIRDLPLDLVDFPDNVTAPMIGERKFRRYCMPWYAELAEILSERRVPVFVHMDGDLEPLWPAIGESAIGGIDSLSPPPDNDTDPGPAHRMWPEMRLFVNFPSSVHLAPPERIYRRTAELLEAAGHSGRLQIQISENVPQGRWRVSYPQIVRAIEDFGRP